VPCFDPQGRFTGYRGTSRDITAQWLAQQERARLEATTRELEVLSYAIAHDVRAPLAAIHGFGEALEELDGAALSAKGKRYLQKIRAAARKMDAMTAGILQLAQISREPPARQPVDLSAVAADAWRTIAAQDPQRWVQVRIEPGLQACGDAVLLALVLQNLLANAWKFTATIAPARVEVVAADGAISGEAVFCVRDNGVGFDAGCGQRLFTPFQRLHSADEFPGTGLGLAIVQKVIQVHGGRVWAESQPGKVAAFFFALPARC
jgi:light-regulated signal transduction histidine kinase (bacteriophytochrome)